MQILMTKSSYERVQARLAAIVPDLEVVTRAPDGVLERDGQAVSLAGINPDIGWVGVDAAYDGTMNAVSAMMAELPNLRWLQSASAGLDRPEFKTMMAKGARITKGNAQAVPIAEYVVGQAISLILPLAQQAALQRDHEWGRTPYKEISNTRWILVGYGNIGPEIAKRIKPFGVDLTVVRRASTTDDLIDRIIPLADLPEALPQADVVVLACALNDETRNLANAAFFRALKPGAILINIGRGGLLDEDALREALGRNQPAHAVLDVFAVEPLPADSWMWDHPQVRVSAHTSPMGDGNIARADAFFLANLKRYVTGEALLNEADKQEVGL